MQQKRIECFKLLLDHIAWIEHQFLSDTRDSRKAGSLWGMMRGVVGVRKSIHQSWLAKGLGLWLGLLCCGQHSSNWVSDIYTRKMHQSITPSLSKTIWERQFLSLPIVQTLFPVTFDYSLSSEVVVMRQLRRWKRLWRRSLTRSHKRTSMSLFKNCRNGTTSALQPEEITSKGTKRLGLGLLCWGFKGVQEEIPSEDASTVQIGSVAIPPGQYTSQQLHPCHRLFDQDVHQDSFPASLSSRLCSQRL